MPRPPRIQAPGSSYHVTSRGNDTALVFRDDVDRRAFLTMLGRVVTGYWLGVPCVLPDGTHFHLLLTTPQANLAAGMQRLKGAYAQAFNHRRDRAGHLFQGRYHAVLVESDGHLLELYRYIALNPVRARRLRPRDRVGMEQLRLSGGSRAASVLRLHRHLAHPISAAIVIGRGCDFVASSRRMPMSGCSMPLRGDADRTWHVGLVRGLTPFGSARSRGGGNLHLPAGVSPAGWERGVQRLCVSRRGRRSRCGSPCRRQGGGEGDAHDTRSPHRSSRNDAPGRVDADLPRRPWCRHPFDGDGIFLRLLSATGAAARTALAHGTSGHYAATVRVPEGGSVRSRSASSLVDGPNGTRRADALFPITNDPVRR